MRYDKLAFLINGLVDPYSWMSLFIVVEFFCVNISHLIKGLKKFKQWAQKYICSGLLQKEKANTFKVQCTLGQAHSLQHVFLQFFSNETTFVPPILFPGWRSPAEMGFTFIGKG